VKPGLGTFETDPANLQPKIRKLNREVAAVAAVFRTVAANAPTAPVHSARNSHFLLPARVGFATGRNQCAEASRG
jgi:hypothetical protein